MKIDPSWHEYWETAIYPAWIKNAAMEEEDLTERQVNAIKKQNGGKFVSSVKLIGTYGDQTNIRIEAGRMEELTKRGCTFYNYTKCYVFTADNPLLPLIAKCTALRIKDKSIVDRAKEIQAKISRGEHVAEDEVIPEEVVSLASAGTTLWKNLCNILYGSSLLNLKKYGETGIVVNNRGLLQSRLNNPRTYDYSIVSGGVDTPAFTPNALSVVTPDLVNSNFIALTKSHSKKRNITSPYHIGYSILHHSKTIMQRLALTIQDFCLDNNVDISLLFTDTDSINTHVDLTYSKFPNKHDFMCALYKAHPEVFDVSSLPGYDCYTDVCCKIPGLLGDEDGGIADPQPVAFVGYRAKSYEFLFSDGSSSGGLKGVNRKKDRKLDGTPITFYDFKDRIENDNLPPIYIKHEGIKMDKVFRRNFEVEKKALDNMWGDDKVIYDELFNSRWSRK